jgi:photosystem II stability/assembly factor-like uncharacterized protein
MQKKWMILLGSIISLIMISGVAFSANPIKLIVNGNLITPEVPPQIIQGNTMVPVRWIAEALGATVEWNGTDQSVSVNMPDQKNLQQQIDLLRNEIAPQTGDEAVQAWAKAVKSRNGAVQYALFSPGLQTKSLKAFEELNWVTGVSSPWVESYQISDMVKADSDQQSYDVSFQLKTSSGSAGGITVKVTVEQIGNKWVIARLQSVDGSDDLNGIVMIPSEDATKAPSGTALQNPESVQMIDSETGWAWGIVDQQPVLLRTADGAKHWTQVLLDHLQLTNINSIKVYFTDALTGWIGWSDGKAMHIAHTADGGQHWNDQTFQGVDYPIQFAFADNQHGWLLTAGDAAMMHNQKKVYRTEDGGTSWKVVSDNGLDLSNPSLQAPSLPTLGNSAGIAFRNTQNGFVAIDDPVSPDLLFYQTSDGGSTWNAVTLNVPQALEGKIDYSAFSVPVFSGEQNKDGAVTAKIGSNAGDTLIVFTTHDGGTTWKAQPLPTSIKLDIKSNISFSDAAHGWLLNGPSLYHTADGGVSWNEIATNEIFKGTNQNAPVIRQFMFSSPQQGWLIAGIEDQSKAVLIETKDGGATWNAVPLQTN